MATFFSEGNHLVLQIVCFLHEFASPVFYAWEYYGYGKMSDFWKEDKAIEAFNQFKASNIREKIQQNYTLMQHYFPFRELDTDGKLQKDTVALLGQLLKDMGK